jgi:hypothetical protein
MADVARYLKTVRQWQMWQIICKLFAIVLWQMWRISDKLFVVKHRMAD